MPAIVRSAKYIKSDFQKNNNKFWYITQFDDNTIESHYGRVGEPGKKTTKPFGSEGQATNFYNRKCSEKERNGRNGEIAYRKLDTISNAASEESTSVIAKPDLKNVALKQIGADSKETQKLITYLAKKNVHNILSTTQLSYNVQTGLLWAVSRFVIMLRKCPSKLRLE